MRLDIYLARKTKSPRHQIQKMIRETGVYVDGEHVTKPSYFLEGNEKVKYDLPIILPLQPPKPEEIPLDILYEDDQIVVVNKQAGLVTHPALNHPNHTLVHGLLYQYEDLPILDDEMKPGIVHRLDKGTSGCLIVARTLEAMKHLQKQFKDRVVEKIYLALLIGEVKARGIIAKPIGRHPKKRHRISSHTKKGRDALTSWEVLEYFGKRYSWVKVTLHTGRTHQIRVHFAEAGHPVFGDPTYGRGSKMGRDWMERPVLHSSRLGIVHPTTNERLTFEAPLPKDLKLLLKNLRA